MIKRFSLTAGLLCLFLLSTAYLSARPGQITSSGLITHRLSDLNTSVYDVYEPTILAGQNSAHVIWTENITYPSPPNWDSNTDLFYAQLPLGQVKHLSAAPGQVSVSEVTLDSNDNAYVVWEDDTNTSEGSDLYYWKTGMTSPQNLSDHDQTEGDIGDYLLTAVDNNDKLHILWAEATTIGPFGPAIFYWVEGGSIQKIDAVGLSSGSFNVTEVISLDTINGVAHLLWRNIDMGTPGGIEPFYWNSNTQTVSRLRPSGQTDYAEGRVHQSFLSENGTFYVLWYDDFEAPTFLTEWNLWDSVSGQNHFIGNSANITSFPKLVQDGNGNAHLLWTESSAVYHWDSLNQTNEVVKQGNMPSVTRGQAGNHIHLAWVAEDSNWPGHLGDVFYLRTNMSQPVNVTDHTEAAAGASDIELLVDETDTAHIFWSEDNYSYYNSTDDVTKIISGTISLEPSYSWPISSQDNVIEFGDFYATSSGIAYMLFASDSTNTTTPYFVWQSDTNGLTPVTAIYGPTDPSSSRMIWLDSANQVHVAWEDDGLAGERTNLHYWNMTAGSHDLTDNDNTDGDIDTNMSTAFGAADASGHVYLAWPEYFDGETDMFAAAMPLKHIYLPAVLK